MIRLSSSPDKVLTLAIVPTGGTIWLKPINKEIEDMLKNSTVRIILAAAVVVLIVAATFAYGNSQRQAQVKKNEQLAEQSVSTSESESPSPSATVSPSATPTPASTPTPTVITPPNGITPETGGEWLAVLPLSVLTVLGVARRNTARDTDAALRASSDR